ncbi:MAG: ornithine carbamoyltransferase [Deltaproteobacteria bacterium]|nr:ornithine carbamoyltransferase [Deltaproteobacteria bacterium]
MKKNSTLKGKSILTVKQLTPEEIEYLIHIAEQLKNKKKRGLRGNLLKRKNIVMIFEKSSTRTRCAFTVAAADEGAHTDYLNLSDIHFVKKESLPDSARVLGRMFDGIAFRGYRHDTAEQLAYYSGIPVWNALTDMAHPTQTFADLLTIKEHFGLLKGLTVVYMGDGRNNVANSLTIGCVKMGMHFVNCTPPELLPDRDLLEEAEGFAAETGGSVRILHEPREAVQGANVIYTDVWVSMGEEVKFENRRKLLQPYQVTMDLMRLTGRTDTDQVIFLHCLPAFHDNLTDVTREIGAMEVTDEVFESSFSRVFDQAENRMHTIKAVMVATLT